MCCGWLGHGNEDGAQNFHNGLCSLTWDISVSKTNQRMKDFKKEKTLLPRSEDSPWPPGQRCLPDALY